MIDGAIFEPGKVRRCTAPTRNAALAFEIDDCVA